MIINTGPDGRFLSAHFEFAIEPDTFYIDIVDERPDMDLDPTLNIYRNDEEEPLVTVHLNPRAACYDEGHVVVRADDCVDCGHAYAQHKGGEDCQAEGCDCTWWTRVPLHPSEVYGTPEHEAWLIEMEEQEG